MLTTLESLSAAELQELENLKDQCENYNIDTEYLLSLLVASNMSAHKAMKLLNKIKLWQSSAQGIVPGSTSISDVAGFYKISQPEPCTAPDATLYIFEDCKGGCARDIEGRPIVVSKGMTYGSEREQLQLTDYLITRANNYHVKNRIKSLCIIFDLTKYEGNIDTFRLPDKDYIKLIEAQKSYFPEYMGLSKVAVVGLPKFFAQVMEVTRQLLGYSNAWTFYENFEKFLAAGTVAADQLPPAFGGTFKFDFETYLRYRAEEENVPWEHIDEIKPRTFKKDAVFSRTIMSKNGQFGINLANDKQVMNFVKVGESSAAAHSCVLIVEGKPSLAVLLPWCEIRIYEGTDIYNPGKMLKAHYISEESCMEVYTDFVFDPAHPQSRGDAADAKGGGDTGSSSTEGNGVNGSHNNNNKNSYSSWYSLSLGISTDVKPKCRQSRFTVLGWSDFMMQREKAVSPVVLEARTEQEKKDLQIIVERIQGWIKAFKEPAVANIEGANVTMAVNKNMSLRGIVVHSSESHATPEIVSELSSDNTASTSSRPKIEPEPMFSSLDFNWGGVLSFLGSSPPPKPPHPMEK